jgi:hypothetical protein
LYAFCPKTSARDEEIKQITDDLLRSCREQKANDFEAYHKNETYDGTGDSLVNAVRAIVVFCLFPYNIPCPILKKAPILLNALAPYYGSSLDNFLPSTGLRAKNRGSIKNFPRKVVDDYVDAVLARANLNAAEHGSVRYALYANARLVYARLVFDPTNLLKSAEPTKSQESILSYDECKKAFDLAKSALIKYLMSAFALSVDQSSAAATNGLIWMIPEPIQESVNDC